MSNGDDKPKQGGGKVFNLDTGEEIKTTPPVQTYTPKILDLDTGSEVPQDDSIPDFTPKGAGVTGSIGEAQSFSAHMGNIGDKFKGLYKSYIDNSSLLLDAALLPSNEHSKALRDRIVTNYDSAVKAAPIFGERMLHFFDAFSKAQVTEVLDKYLGKMDFAKGDPLNEIFGKPLKGTGKIALGAAGSLSHASTYGALAEGALDTFLFRPAELALGEEFAEDNRQSTPEERELKGRKLLADVIMVLATHKTSGALNRMMIGEAAPAIEQVGGTLVKSGYEGANALDNKILQDAAKGPQYGAIARKAVANSVGGAVGGFAGGLVSASGDHDALESALINAVMGVPLGWAQDFAGIAVRKLRGKMIDTPEEISLIAQSIFAEKQLKLYADDSYAKATQKLAALATSNDLGEAASKLGEEKAVGYFDKTVVKNPDGSLKVMFHGTDKGYHEYDPEHADPYALYGPGYYSTENADIAGHEKGSYAVDPNRPARTIEDFDKELKIKKEELQSLNDLETIQKNNILNPEDDYAPDSIDLEEIRKNNPDYDQLLTDIQAHEIELEKLTKEREDFLARGGPSEGPNVRPAVLNIENPLDIDKTYSAEEAKKILGGLDIPEIPQKPYSAMTGGDIYSMAERHYGSNKKAINERLAEIGYDGITHIGGARTGNPPHRVYIAFKPEQIQTPWGAATKNMELAMKLKRFDIERFKQNFYDEWNHFAYQTSNIMEAEPRDGFHFDRMLYEFAQSKGIKAEYVPALREDIVNRMRQESLDAMEPDERFAYSRMKGELQKAQENLREEYVNEGARVARKAYEQGMYIDRDPDGSLVMRSRQTGDKILDMKDSEDLMRGFAEDAGRPRGVSDSSDPSVGIPTDAVPIKPPPEEPPKNTNIYSTYEPRVTTSGKIIDWFNTTQTGSLFTSVKDAITSLDNKHKTRILSKVYLATQIGSRKVTAALQPHMKVLNEITHDYRRFSNLQWRQVGEYREARTAKELVDRFTKTRGVSPIEQSQGQWLYDNDINISKIFEYDRAFKNIQGLEGERFDQAKEALDKQLLMSPRDLEAHARKQVIQQGSRNNSDYGAVISYARALKSGISKKDYAFKYNLTPEQIRAAERLDGFYDSLAKELKVDSRQQLEDYMNHYKRYKEYPDLPESMTRSEEFLSLMPRTGEIEAYESHPIAAASRYATAGIKTRELYPIWNKAQKDIAEEIDKIPTQGQRDNANIILNDYMEGIIGNRQFLSKGSIEHLASTLKSRGYQGGEEEIKAAVRKWTSFYFATAESSAQGFRPSQGIRDFYTTMNNHYLRFGAYRANRALWLFKNMTEQQIKELEQGGRIGTLQPYEAISTEQASSEMRDWMKFRVRAFYDASFKGSLQKQAYRNGHAMIYNETYINSMEWLSKMMDGTVNEKKAYDKMWLHAYDPSVATEFNRIFQETKDPRQASQFLAQVTAIENVFAYGAANQPRLMSKAAGALLGQFGVWPLWESRFITRLMSRGTIKNRLAAGSRYAMSQMSLAAADGLTGFNLSSWFLTPSSILMRAGPLAQATVNAFDSSSPNERIATQAINAIGNQAGLLIPGNQFTRGAQQAFDLWYRGYDPITVGARVAGVGVDEQNKNWWDALLRGGELAEVHVPLPIENPTIDIPHESSVRFDEGRESIPNQIFGIKTEKKPPTPRKKKEVKATNQQ